MCVNTRYINSTRCSASKVCVHPQVYLWWSLCTLCLHTCQVRVTVGNSGLCCWTYITYLERWLTPLFFNVNNHSYLPLTQTPLTVFLIHSSPSSASCPTFSSSFSWSSSSLSYQPEVILAVNRMLKSSYQQANSSLSSSCLSSFVGLASWVFVGHCLQGRCSVQ